MSKSREQLIRYLKEIDITDKTVLDFGAGAPDHWIKHFVKGTPTVYQTSDIDREFPCDFNVDLNLADPFFISHNYDIVFCIEVLEHIWNPLQAIENLFYLTNDILYLSTPFINPIHDKWDYLRYTDEWFEKVLSRQGFHHLTIEKRTSEIVGQFYLDEGMRMGRVRSGQEEKLNTVGYFIRAYKHPLEKVDLNDYAKSDTGL